MNSRLRKIIKSNKGFTLVELVVVIAIIGVIMAAISVMYIGYVEKSRRASDDNAISEVARAAETSYVSYGGREENTTIKVRIDSAGEFMYGASVLTEQVNKIIPEGSYIYKSKAYRNNTITITVEGTTGKATVNGPDESTANKGKWQASDLGIADDSWIGGKINSVFDKIDDEQWEEINKVLFEVGTSIDSWDTMESDEKKTALNTISPGLGDLADRFGVLDDPSSDEGSEGTDSGGTGSEGTGTTTPTPTPTPCASCNCTDNTNCSSNHKTLSRIEAFFAGYSNKCNACGATW